MGGKPRKAPEPKLISAREAIDGGISKLRLTNWADPNDHIELHLTESGHVGPWVKLWSPVNEVIGSPNPQTLLYMSAVPDPGEKIWEVYVPAES